MPQSERDRLFELASKMMQFAISHEMQAENFREDASRLLAQARRLQQEEEAEKG